MLRVAECVNDSIVDGPGFRYAVFTQGCFHGCEGCHNPQTHDPAGGHEITAQEILDKLQTNPLLDGITLTGGEPFLQAEALIPLAKGAKAMGLHVMAYSGYTFEELLQLPSAEALLQYVDMLIDGPFIAAKRTLELRFRGSANQRVIDVPRSLAAGTAIETTL